MATILRADGTRVELLGTRADGTLTLLQLQTAVGGSIDIVRLRRDGKTMVVHDEGVILGLPVNVEGTRLYRANTLPNDFSIHGDVVLAEPWEVT